MSKKMNKCIEGQKWEECMKIVAVARTTAVRIYNLIREVGQGKLSADNALHQMIEDYKNLHDLGDKAQKLASWIDELAIAVEAEADRE